MAFIVWLMPNHREVGFCIGAIEETAAIKSCELPIELERSES